MRLLKSLFALLLFGTLVQTLWLVVPPVFYNYQFEDVIRREAVAATYSTRSEDEIHDSIFRQATELKLPLAPPQIRVRRNRDGVSISAAYTVPIDLIWHPFEISFNPSSSNTAPEALK